MTKAVADPAGAELKSPNPSFGHTTTEEKTEKKGPAHDRLCMTVRSWRGSGHCYCLCRHCWNAASKACICQDCPCGGWRHANALALFKISYEE
jgi:hypothetical protein